MIEEQHSQTNPSSSQSKKPQRHLEPLSKFKNYSRSATGGNSSGRLYSVKKPLIGHRFTNNLPRQRNGDFFF